jgi:hypothetical protein
MDAYVRMDTTDPKMSIRIGRGTPRILYVERIARILRQGKTGLS